MFLIRFPAVLNYLSAPLRTTRIDASLCFPRPNAIFGVPGVTSYFEIIYSGGVSSCFMMHFTLSVFPIIRTNGSSLVFCLAGEHKLASPHAERYAHADSFSELCLCKKKWNNGQWNKFWLIISYIDNVRVSTTTHLPTSFYFRVPRRIRRHRDRRSNLAFLGRLGCASILRYFSLWRLVDFHG